MKKYMIGAPLKERCSSSVLTQILPLDSRSHNATVRFKPTLSAQHDPCSKGSQ